MLRDNRFGLAATMQVAWCPACGLGVTLDPLQPNELDALYAGHYVPTSEGSRTPSTTALARMWHRVNGTLAIADESLEGPVLDIGCHTGELLETLKARGLDVVGLEPNPAAAATVRAKGIEVIEAPIERASLPPGRFGTIVLSQILEHVHAPAELLALVRRALREDGVVVAAVPNAGGIWRRVFGTDWAHWHVPFHLWHFSPRSFRLLLTQAGFSVDVIRTRTPGEWLLMSMDARRNAKRGVYQLQDFSGRFGARIAVAPAARISDLAHRGDALYAVARVR
ncbi:MAG: class I SAM-dependent methyltransferase [Gaiellaceae bacterium]